MKKILLPLLMGIVLQAATYQSVTDEVDAITGKSGFDNQFNALTQYGDPGGDIAVSLKNYVPYNAKLLSGTAEEAKSSNLYEVDYCTRGMLRVKVYVPPHLDKFQAVVSFRPNNSGILYASFQPQGSIDEAYPVDLSSDSNTYWNSFWNAHKTIEFIMSNVYSFTFTQTYINRYNIDTSKGGYLYLSFTQADTIVSNKEYHPNYAITVSAYYTFKTPMTAQMKQDIINDYSKGEPDQQIRTNECTNYQLQNGKWNFIGGWENIVVEDGDPKTACEDQGSNYSYIDGECFNTLSDKYKCLYNKTDDIDGVQWITDTYGTRCKTRPEIDCLNAQDKWYVDGTFYGQCLPGENQSVEGVIVETPDKAAVFSPFQANEQDWMSQLKLTNSNTQAPSAYSITVRGKADQNNTLIEFLKFSVDNNKSVILELTKPVSGTLYADLYDQNGSVRIRKTFQTADRNGSVWIRPEYKANGEMTSLDVNQTAFEFKYGTNLSSVAVTQSNNNGGGSSGSGDGSNDSGSGTYNGDGVYAGGGTSSGGGTTGSTGGTSDSGDSGNGTYNGDGAGTFPGDTASGGGTTGSTGGTSESGNSDNVSQPTAYETIEDKLLADSPYTIIGWIYHYDFKIADAFDYVFISSMNKQLYRLQPTSKADLYWTQVEDAISLDKNDTLYAVVLAGDWDVDGSAKNDWVLIDMNDNDKVYKLLPHPGNGTLVLDENPTSVSANISDQEVIFTSK